MSWVKESADVVAAVWTHFSGFVQTHSIWIGQFTNGLILLLRQFEIINWKPGQEDAVQGFVLLLTTAFMAKTNVASTRVDAIKDKARDEGKETGIAMASPPTVGTGTGRGTGDGTLPPGT